MAEKIVINTSPIIAFEKMQALDIVSRLPLTFACPIEVKNEILAGTAKGLTVAFPSWIQILPLSKPLSPLILASLDAGEATVIELALERKISTVCMDETKGRRAALASGLQIVGSLGLIGKAKTLGLISSVRPFIEKAQSGGIFYDAKLVENFIKSLGE